MLAKHTTSSPKLIPLFIYSYLANISKGMTDLARDVRRGSVIVTSQRGIELPDFGPYKDPEIDALEERVYQALTAQFGTIELPRLMMEIDAQVRFSSICCAAHRITPMR